MTDPVRATIGIRDPRSCPVAEASAATERPIQEVSRASVPTRAGTITEEFRLPPDASTAPADAELVFSCRAGEVYRFEREPERGCVCDRIERAGCPVTTLTARDGALVVSFHAPSVDIVGDIVADLSDRFDGVRIHQLSHHGGEVPEELVLVDRGALTARQREVLETSVAMGYFEHPRAANAEAVAAALEIASSTFREHLAVAQRKLLESLLCDE